MNTGEELNILSWNLKLEYWMNIPILEQEESPLNLVDLQNSPFPAEEEPGKSSSEMHLAEFKRNVEIGTEKLA